MAKELDEGCTSPDGQPSDMGLVAMTPYGSRLRHGITPQRGMKAL